MDNQKTFRLSDEESNYILTLMSEDISFRTLLSNHSEFYINEKVLTLDHDKAELLRDYFTDRLAKIGFDKNYEPNKEGVMLERLTDKLFIPDEEWLA